MTKLNLPLDASAKAVLERARNEAARLGHEYVGTEHLALALLRLTPLIANQVIQDLGVNQEAMRAAIQSAVASVPCSAAADSKRPFTSRTHHAFALAQQCAAALGATAVGAEHLLVGLLQEPGVGGQILVRHGLSAEAVLGALLRTISPSSSSEP